MRRLLRPTEGREPVSDLHVHWHPGTGDYPGSWTVYFDPEVQKWTIGEGTAEEALAGLDRHIADAQQARAALLAGREYDS